MHKAILPMMQLSSETIARRESYEMDRKIIDLPTYASLRRPWAKATRQETPAEVVELTLTIPKAEPGPTTIRF